MSNFRENYPQFYTCNTNASGLYNLAMLRCLSVCNACSRQRNEISHNLSYLIPSMRGIFTYMNKWAKIQNWLKLKEKNHFQYQSMHWARLWMNWPQSTTSISISSKQNSSNQNFTETKKHKQTCFGISDPTNFILWGKGATCILKFEAYGECFITCILTNFQHQMLRLLSLVNGKGKWSKPSFPL